MKLGHVLQSTLRENIKLDGFRSDELKRAARFWVGKEAGSYNKENCIAALTRVMNGDDAARRVQAALSEKERQVLAIFTRYGPTVSGGLLTAEIYARGLAETPPKHEGSGGYYAAYHEWRRNDVVRGLCEKLVLAGNSYDSYYSSSYTHSYPRLTLHPALLKAVAPAAPLSWSASSVCDEAVGTGCRSSAEVVLGLWRVAAALRGMGTWPTVKGDSPSKATRARMRKEVGLRDAEKDPLSPPDPESLFYELLHGMGLMNFGDKSQWIREQALERHLQQPSAMQAWHWVRAWLHLPLWQDGIGVVPERDSDYTSVRIEPGKLHLARELLSWALCGVAHTSNRWLDLEAFLRDLWQATQQASIDFYWDSFAWNPEFEMARKKEQFPAGEKRTLAFWFACEAVWAANAIMVTLVTLGLVERGHTADKKIRPCFRLTELGRTVFGAPEVEAAAKPEGARFLTVQPNLEVVAYLESADARQIFTLNRFAAGASRASGPVQTFALGRASLYGALESGMTLDEVRAFLTKYGKTELPANVDRMLSEWAGRRDSLVLRTKVALALGAAETRTRGRTLNSNAFLLPSLTVKIAGKEFGGWTILDHEDKPERTWTTDELGSLTTNGGHSISRLRLARIADRMATGWQITQQSIGRARISGMTADQILGWLGENLTAEVPGLLEVAVRNGTSRQGIELSQVQLLRITQAQAKEALLYSAAFRPLLAGHIPPEWFLIRDDHLSELRGLLERLGFTIADSLNPPPLRAVQNPTKDSPAAILRIRSDPERRRVP
jgi:Helicase conserved C-terminal domain